MLKYLTMNKKLKILFCNTDYGSAEQNFFFIKQNRQINIKNSVIVSTSINKRIFSKVKCDNKIYVSGYSILLEKKITAMFEKKKIDFVILGLTYKKNSLENNILKLLKKFGVKSGSIQDYWGHTGGFEKFNMPDIFWVADKFAKKTTLQKVNNSIVEITGIPKYENLKNEIILKKNNTKRKNIVIIGQPISLLGIKFFYNSVANIVSKIDYDIFFLAHPDDAKHSIKFFTKKIKNIKFIKKNFFLYSLLSKKTIIISYISTLAYDLIYAKYKLNVKSSVVIFFRIGKKILKLSKRDLGTSELPLAEENISIAFNNEKKLLALLNDSKSINILGDSQLSNAKKYFTKFRNSSKRITQSIIKILKKNDS